MRKNLLKFIAISLLVPVIVSAATCGNGICESGENSSNCPFDCPFSGGGKLESILNKIKDTLKTLGYVVCAIFIIIGGYQMITASGNPQKFDTGKRTLLFAAIGFIIILAADKIVDFLRSIVQ
jgi:type IV secretory pathway VirB2 component (pilin)